MNVEPNASEKAKIIDNSAEVLRKIGIEKPKVAVLASIEVVNPKMQATVDAAILCTMNKRKQIKNCIVDGPFAMDNAISKEACMHKNIDSEVGGDPDLLLMPDLNAANSTNKTINFLGGATMAGVILGAKVPVVLVSRSDTAASKLASLALASVIS